MSAILEPSAADASTVLIVKDDLRVRPRLRTVRQESDAVVSQGTDLKIDRINRRARRAGRLIEVTAREFDRLAFLAQNAGCRFSRVMLVHEIWNLFSRATSMDTVIDVHQSLLRDGIENGPADKLIRARRGVGFVLSETAP